MIGSQSLPLKSLAFCLLAFLISSICVSAQRVVSLAPGLTEIVFAIGRGDSLVGVTKFCDYPAAASRIEKVGGLLDINLEALVARTPDIVIAYPENAERIKFLQGRVRVLTVRHGRLSELLGSIREIGRALSAGKEAEGLVHSIQAGLDKVADRVREMKRVRALCVAGRNAADLRNMYIIGNSDFINDLLQIAGGENAYKGSLEYPSISLESVIALDPEAIFEISSYYDGVPDERIFVLWRPFPMITAVAKNQIHVIKDSFWLRPGPRVVRIAEEMAAILHGKRGGR